MSDVHGMGFGNWRFSFSTGINPKCEPDVFSFSLELIVVITLVLGMRLSQTRQVDDSLRLRGSLKPCMYIQGYTTRIICNARIGRARHVSCTRTRTLARVHIDLSCLTAGWSNVPMAVWLKPMLESPDVGVILLNVSCLC